MQKDYMNAVVREYRDKVSSKTISLNLVRLTPGRIKNECLAVCKSRFRKSDEPILSAVFGYAEDQSGYFRAIGRCPIDRFRPLIYFLKGRNKDTNENNIELLAWLIDFKNRPFDSNIIYDGVNPSIGADETKTGTAGSTGLENDPWSISAAETKAPSTVTTGENRVMSSQKSRSKKNVLIAALIATLFAGTAGYISLNKPTSGYTTSNNDSCMYWKDDHYERISCGQKVQYTKPVALDQDLLNDFKRITTPDTITYNSIGKVWYVKIKGKAEFYTGMGYHPVFTHLQLKPVTEYIIDNHIRKNTLSNNSVDSSILAVDTSVGQSDNFRLSSKQLKTPSPGIYGRCQAITKAKTRCSRDAKPGGFCWQHQKQRT